MHSQQHWGGKTVLLGGDPRQTLPVIKRASRAQIVTACIQMSPLYPLMKHHKLNINMRTDTAEKDFSNYLLALGDGKLTHEDTEVQVQIPPQHLNTLISYTFPDQTQFRRTTTMIMCLWNSSIHCHPLESLIITSS